MHKVDNLIVGAGIAGTWMAFQSIKYNQSFALISQDGHSKSSTVAAGIYNPILANRQKLSYNADLIYSDLSKKYHEMEVLIHEKILHHHPVTYIIESLKELNDWAALAQSHIFKDFVLMKNERISDHTLSDFGVLEIVDSGWVDVKTMMRRFRHFISEPNYFFEKDFIAEDLIQLENGFVYQDIEAKNIIFCQGTASLNNPFTQDIPLKPAKGEILIIEAEEKIEEIIPQNAVFMLPIGLNFYRVGSNFEWNELDYQPTEKALNEIVNKLTKWYKGAFEIIGQVAGIRPSSLDRRPILGRLNMHKNAFILNGLGSKGVALSPYYSKMLMEHIVHNKAIDAEVDVKRYYKN
jgi:glycine/D-amino acid oxidase-like deaminating enzyme